MKKFSDILDDLSHSDDFTVQAKVSKNPQTSSETLDRLHDHPSEFVRQNISLNPNTHPDTLHKMAVREHNFFVKDNILSNKNARPETLLHIYDHSTHDAVLMRRAYYAIKARGGSII